MIKTILKNTLMSIKSNLQLVLSIFIFIILASTNIYIGYKLYISKSLIKEDNVTITLLKKENELLSYKIATQNQSILAQQANQKDLNTTINKLKGTFSTTIKYYENKLKNLNLSEQCKDIMTQMDDFKKETEEYNITKGIQ